MDSFAVLAERCTNASLREVFKVINGRAGAGYVSDASAQPIKHSAEDIWYIRETLHDEVRARMVSDGAEFQTLSECQRRIRTQVRDSVVRIARDGFFNPVSGFGTSIDPAVFNYAYVPVSMSPEEATALYSSGGIPARIIDKKSKGILLNGYTFIGDGWKSDECKRLHDYAEQLGFGRVLSAGIRDALIYGGAILYPVFDDDTPLSYGQSFSALLESGVLKKGSLRRFVQTDRWNTVLVPSWDVTAEDYIYPREFYVPLGGVRVATERSALIRPKMLPFWGAIRQIGWGVSDFESYAASLLDYEIMIRTLPIMFQQMSLLFQAIPMDAAMMQNGPQDIEELIKYNSEKLREMSALNPKAIGMAGELKVVERHYEALNELFMIKQQDVSAKCGIPVSVLWAANPTGLSDSREEDVELKQSETLVNIGNEVAPSLAQVVRCVAVSCFGPEVVDRLGSLQVSFDVPVVESTAKRAEAGVNFATVVQTLTGAQMPLDLAIRLTELFFPSVEVPTDIMDRLESVDDEPVPEGYDPIEAVEAAADKIQALTGQQMGPRLVSEAVGRVAQMARAPSVAGAVDRVKEIAR